MWRSRKRLCRRPASKLNLQKSLHRESPKFIKNALRPSISNEAGFGAIRIRDFDHKNPAAYNHNQRKTERRCAHIGAPSFIKNKQQPQCGGLCAGRPDSCRWKSVSNSAIFAACANEDSQCIRKVPLPRHRSSSDLCVRLKAQLNVQPKSPHCRVRSRILQIELAGDSQHLHPPGILRVRSRLFKKCQARVFRLARKVHLATNELAFFSERIFYHFWPSLTLDFRFSCGWHQLSKRLASFALLNLHKTIFKLFPNSSYSCFLAN